MIDSQSAADFDDWWPRALSPPPLLTALPQPRCLIQGGATTRAGERDSRRSPDLRRADELRLVCVEDVHRRAIIAPYDALPVVHYFAGANVEDNLTGGGCTPGRR